MRGTEVPRAKFVVPIVNDVVENKISAKQLYDKLAPRITWNTCCAEDEET